MYKVRSNLSGQIIINNETVWQIWEDQVNTTNSIKSVNQLSHSLSNQVIWGPVIRDGRALTDLGSGVGQRITLFWSNMAYLTGLGSGRVQCTAGAVLTMTAPWQVYLRWVCLMYTRPLFILVLFPHYLFPIRRLFHFILVPFPWFYLLPPFYHSPSSSSLFSLTELNVLISSLFTPITLPMTVTTTHYLPTICSQDFYI